jgi:hypothetical protein
MTPGHTLRFLFLIPFALAEDNNNLYYMYILYCIMRTIDICKSSTLCRCEIVLVVQLRLHYILRIVSVKWCRAGYRN